jgi:hypothetical protein
MRPDFVAACQLAPVSIAHFAKPTEARPLLRELATSAWFAGRQTQALVRLPSHYLAAKRTSAGVLLFSRRAYQGPPVVTAIWAGIDFVYAYGTRQHRRPLPAGRTLHLYTRPCQLRLTLASVVRRLAATF